MKSGEIHQKIIIYLKKSNGHSKIEKLNIYVKNG